MKLASFDIFDTALIRKCGKPENIFYLSAKQMFANDEMKGEAFVAWRKQAEQEACRRHKTKNVTIVQIYQGFDEQGFGQTAAFAIEIERKTEKENLQANPAIKEIMEEKRSFGYRICFISDMYLDAAFLKEVLIEQKLILPEEEIFVSCEWDARKSTGSLFKQVKDKYRPSLWEHYGDNRMSDYRIPRKQGIRAFTVNTNYTDAEIYVENKYKYHRIYNKVSLFVGFQRAARLVAGNDSFAEIAADFVSPAYIIYTSYVLKQAKERGIKRLYFVNRDGYILQKIAEMLQMDYPDIEIKYIFISRKAITAASLIQADPKRLIETLNPQTLIGKKVSDLLSYLQIDPKALAEKGITFVYDRITNRDESDDFTNKLFHSEFTPEWEERIRQDRELFKRYLEEEGVTDNEKAAMVDLGWYGSTRLMLNRLLNHYGYASIPFFYFAAADNALPFKYGPYLTFMPYQLIRNSGLMPVFECYCSASPYHSVKQFKEEDGRIVPIEEDRALSSDYLRIVETNIRVVKQILSFMKGIELDDVLELLQTDYWILMKEQRIKINLEAFKAVGDMSGNPNRKEVFVKKMSLMETIRYAFEGKRITEFDRASLSLTYNPFWRRRLFALHDYSHKLRRLVYSKYISYKQK